MIILELKISIFEIIKSVSRYNRYKTSKKVIGKLEDKSLVVIQVKACRQEKM